MKKSLNQIVVDILKETGKSLTAREISEIIIQKEPEFCDIKKKNTTKKTTESLITQLVAEIGSRYPQIQQYNILRTADRPKKLFYNKQNNNCNIITYSNSNITISNSNEKEFELYGKLAEYCNSIGIKTLRINEKKTQKTNGSKHNKWLHADVVGFKDLSKKYSKETKESFNAYSNEKSVLYSFEVKKGCITDSVLREYFFQTVSNSSWANYSYLVAEEIEDNAKEELQLLCASFNIGFIQINRETPTESDIVIHAPKTDLDWNMMDRISINPDFKQFLYNISKMYGKHSNEEYLKIKWDI